MNNKGFAISAMLYGTFLMFLMLLLAMLGMINSFKSNMDLLIEDVNGARGIVERKCSDFMDDKDNDGVIRSSEKTTIAAGMSSTDFIKIVNMCGYQYRN